VRQIGKKIQPAINTTPLRLKAEHPSFERKGKTTPRQQTTVVYFLRMNQRPPVYSTKHARSPRAVPQTRDTRIQRELKELQTTHDLREIDDDVEQLATLFEWRAAEHIHRPKTQRWFMTLALVAAIVVIILALTLNIIGAITLAFVCGLIYVMAQRKPRTLRYRIMVDGVAIGNTLYQFEDLSSFNIIYEPNETKVLLIRSSRPFSGLIAMELGATDPNDLRDMLLEFLPEDQQLKEPIADQLARRFGFSG